MNKEEFLEKARKIHGDKYDYSLVEYKKTLSKVKIICSKHGIFEQRVDSHYIRGCPKCSYEMKGNKRRLDQDELIESFKDVHGDKYDYSDVVYINRRHKIKIKCPEHGIFEQRPLDHRSGNGCVSCAIEKNKKLLRKDDIWFEKCRKKFKNKYDYSLVNYISDKIEVKIICPNHGEFEQTPVSHYKHGCTKCSYDTMIFNNKNNFIKNSNLIHSNKYDYSLIEYVNNKTKVKIICPKHGIFEQKPDAHVIGVGCTFCKESKGEKKIAKLLNLYKVKYVRQHKFDDCKYKRRLPFDFYLNDYNCCIEFDGNQHFRVINFWTGGSDYISTIRNDKIKNNYCKNNNIRLLRIKYTKFNKIELILTRFLKLLLHQ